MSPITVPRLLGVLLAALVMTGAAPRQSPDRPIALENLQGRWEGKGPAGAVAVTIREDVLHFFARDDFWYEAKITLVAGTRPQQLRAEIIGSAAAGAGGIGEFVMALVALEEGTLKLAVDDGSDTAPTSFEDATSEYQLRLSVDLLRPFDG